MDRQILRTRPSGSDARFWDIKLNRTRNVHKPQPYEIQTDFIQYPNGTGYPRRP